MDHLANRCTVIGSAPHAGVFSGRARIIWNDGDIFEGFLRENQLVVGEMSYAGGDVYRGDYLHGLMHGQVSDLSFFPVFFLPLSRAPISISMAACMLESIVTANDMDTAS